jgi:hypothetical protein
MMGNMLAPLLAAGIAAALLLIAIGVVTSIRRAGAYEHQRASLAAAAGLSPVHMPDPAFVDRLAHLLRQNNDDELSVANVFKSDRLDHTLYMLDVKTRPRSGEHSAAVSSIVAIRSPRLRLPRLSVRPKLNFQGAVGGALSRFVNGFITARAPQDLTHVDLRAFGEIDADYVLFGADHGAVRAVLTNGLGALLRRCRWFMIEAEGDLLAMSRLDLDAWRAGAKVEGKSPQSILQDAQQLYEACGQS